MKINKNRNREYQLLQNYKKLKGEIEGIEGSWFFLFLAWFIPSVYLFSFALAGLNSFKLPIIITIVFFIIGIFKFRNGDYSIIEDKIEKLKKEYFIKYGREIE